MKAPVSPITGRDMVPTKKSWRVRRSPRVHVRTCGIPAKTCPEKRTRAPNPVMVWRMCLPSSVVSQGALLEHVYGQDFAHESNAVEVLIGRLRKKLGAGFIRTRRGLGYIVGGE